MVEIIKEINLKVISMPLKEFISKLPKNEAHYLQSGKKYLVYYNSEKIGEIYNPDKFRVSKI